LALFHETVSAIVIGFGAVLIGISIDFAMHVYFAIARHQGDPGTATQALTKPILFCVLTSCAAFGALFLSGIPGIRQLALFSICGLIASSILSLFILPLMSNKATVRPMPSGLSLGTSPYPKLALTLWAIIMGICIWFGSSTSIDPDLRNIGYRPTSLQETEKRFSSIWGDIRSRGVVFAQANTLQEALLKNDNVYADLKSAYPTLKATSISPLLPSDKSQRNSQELWDKFWTNERIHQVETDIRKAGTSLGFSKKAFHPFEILLQTRPVNINADSLEIASMGLIKNMFLLKSSSGKTVVTYVPDTKEVRSFFSPKKEQALGVHMVSNARFKSLLESTMKSDIKYFITASGSAVFVLAFLLFRDFRRSSLALLPAITGITAVFGVLGMTNTDLNLFHITALPLIIGLGADYGIFIVTEESQALELSTVPAVTVSGLTTLAGFGVLSLARHPSLHSMGVTVLIGITAALICALFIIPHFLRKLS